MDKRLRDEWVAALRSGEYKQGKGLLKDGDKYCCLGVLCVINGLDFVYGDEDNNSPVGFKHGDCCEAEFLPSSFADLVGLSSGDQRSLAHMNDAGRSFASIASEIERIL